MCSFVFQAFTITCATQRNNTNLPFTILSNISLSDLRVTVAKKLNCYPDNLALAYRLDSDKAKMGLTSIQSDSELQMFVERMWPMIVAPRLSNGRPSARVLKTVTVIFDAADTANEPSEGPTHSNKASYHLYFVCED